MENASKNAGEILDKLTLQYNKARQSKITMELIEIISGASVWAYIFLKHTYDILDKHGSLDRYSFKPIRLFGKCTWIYLERIGIQRDQSWAWEVERNSRDRQT